MTDIIVALILVAIVGCSAFYVYKAKKSGQKCVGCPHSKECGNSCHCKGK